MFPLSPLAIKGIAAILLVAASTGAYTYWHHHVFQQGVTQEKDKRDKINALANLAAVNKLSLANDLVKETQLSLTTALSQIDVKNLELKNANKKLDSLSNSLRTGADKLRIAVQSCASDTAKQGDGSSTSGGTGTTSSAELLQETLESLGAIADDADAEVRRANELIDRYNAIAAAINGK